MGLSVRLRFEVFKRDNHTCQYCGRKSPDVVLQCDHIVPVSAGGQDDIVNLITACWECNSGKSDKPLNEILTGEDPHDRAILLLEKERQLKEYNAVLARQYAEREQAAWELVRYWKTEQGITKEKDLQHCARPDWNWLFGALQWCPAEQIRLFMDAALSRNMTANLRYVAGCCRNWRYEHTANQDWKKGEVDY